MNTSNQIAHLPAEYRTGRYTINGVLSESDVSITYLATDETSRRYVLKEYCPAGLVRRRDDGGIELLDDNNREFYLAERQTFIESGRIISEINHPNIVNVIEVISDNHSVCLISEYVDAVSLGDIFKQTAVLDFEDVKSIVFPIMEGLKLLHGKNVLHLSIAPDNILIRSNGAPVLTGFGSFYRNTAGNVALRKVSNNAYAPPEQYTRQTQMIGPWSDIYALGAVLYQCITGSPPPQSLERYNAAKQTGHDPLEKALDRGRSRFSVRTLNAIDHALELKPVNRPAAVSEWAQEFMAITPMDSKEPPAEVPDLDQTLEIQIHSGGGAEQGDSIGDAGSHIKLLMAFLGGNKQSYYMSSFLNQQEWGWLPRARWNFGAFLFGYFWMLYRKMYLCALVLAGISVPVLVYLVYPAILQHTTWQQYLLVNPAVDLALLLYVMTIAVLLGNYGNYLYYLHAESRIRSVAKNTSSISSQRAKLSKHSGVSWFTPALLLLATVPLANYGYFQMKMHDGSAQEQISEAVTALSMAQKLAYDFRVRNGRWPNNTELHDLIGGTTYSYVDAITIIEQLIVVSFKSGSPVVTGLGGRAFGVFGNENPSDNSVRWICGSIDIPLALLPQNCKTSLSR